MAARKRALTAGEKKLLREVFADKLDYDRIRLQDGAGSNPLARIAFRSSKNWAMTYRNTIHYNKGHFQDDFSAAGGKYESLLVHEMTHVWQYVRLGLLPFALRYGWNFVSCDFDQQQMYDYSKAPDFASATLEGQAQMVGHYYHGRHGPDGPVLKTKLARTGLYGL